MVRKSSPHRKGAHKKARKRQPAVEQTYLGEALSDISYDLEELLNMLERMPGASIFDLESDIWEAVRVVKSIQDAVAAIEIE